MAKEVKKEVLAPIMGDTGVTNTVEVTGVIVFAKQHKGDKGGVNVYYIQQLEQRVNKDGEDYEHKHSYLAKEFFMAGKPTKLKDVGLTATFKGRLKTESYKLKDADGNATDQWQENTFIELDSITL
jgi:hypothetical protein